MANIAGRVLWLSRTQQVGVSLMYDRRPSVQSVLAARSCVCLRTVYWVFSLCPITMRICCLFAFCIYASSCLCLPYTPLARTQIGIQLSCARVWQPDRTRWDHVLCTVIVSTLYPFVPWRIFFLNFHPIRICLFTVCIPHRWTLTYNLASLLVAVDCIAQKPVRVPTRECCQHHTDTLTHCL
jgi:hypothetical protein